MRTILACLALVGTSAPLSAQAGLEGEWVGYWARAGDSMAVTLTVRRDAADGYRATFSADRLRVSGIPFNSVELRGCCDVTMTLRGDRTTTVFAGSLRGDTLAGDLREGDGDGRFRYVRAASAGADVVEEEVSFANGDITLAGTLLMPATGQSVPAVVFVHGSGAEGRWASRFLAAALARRGVAALIFDKRGVGASGGDWRTASIDDLASDGAAAVAFLRRHRRIDARRVGVHGHSQGGTLVPLVASRAEGIAFVVGSAAAGLPTDSVEIYSVLNSVLPRAVSAEDTVHAREYVGALVGAAYHGRPRSTLDSLTALFRGRPWFFAPPAPDNSYWTFSPEFARFRPLDWWRRVRVPALLVYGAADQRVPAEESAGRIAAALRAVGNADVTVRIYPGADHTFRMPPAASGWPVTAPGYVDDLVDWLTKR